ncbi:MAG: urate hydroxylase PuuD [Elusimicrobia bacterium]|nr:urate hydroxylase PuuD [Elusimicrobiota bacterium]
MADANTTFQFLFRWLHVMAGITWIGHLYFFNFVNVPLQGALDDAAKKAVNPKLMPRALWWFRWGAMITFISGLVLFGMIYMGANLHGLFYDMSGHVSDRALWIMTGMLLGTIMWFNVWFVIWPAQKKILSGQVQGDELAATRKRAGQFSRINTYLSGPMLFGMLAANHYPSLSFGAVAVFALVGLGAIWGAIYHSFIVGQSV